MVLFVIIGCGEQLMRTLLAKSLADSIRLSDKTSCDDQQEPAITRIDKTMNKSFLGNTAL